MGCMRGFQLSSSQLPHRVSNLTKPTEPSRQSRAEESDTSLCAHPCSCFEAWEVAVSFRKRSGTLLPFKELAWPPHDQTEGERVGLALEPWQSQRSVVRPLLFSLGWDKPGSVAPLRLVGCLIETPAPSWAYFYSIFSLSLFFPPPILSSLLLFFFIRPLSPSLSVYLFSAVFFFHGVGMRFGLYAWERKTKKPKQLGFWFGSQYSLAFFSPLFLSCCIYFTQTLAKMAEAACHWFGSDHAVYIFKVL